MKYHCPYCHAVADWRTGCTCPSCGKTALLPGFYAASKRSSSRVSVRAEARDWHEPPAPWFAGGGLWQVFRPRSVYARVTLWIGFVCILGAALYGPRQAPLATPEIVALARDNLVVLRTALAGFREDCGRYPSTEEGLAALLTDPGLRGWRGPYITNLRPDPWGHPFLYRASATGLRLFSVGPDGVEGTADDIDANDSPGKALPAVTEVTVGPATQTTTKPGVGGR